MEEENKRVEGEIDLQGEVSKEKFLSLSLSLFLSLFTKIEEGTNVGKTVEKSTYDVSIHWMKRERKASVTRISRSPDDDEENVFFGGEGRVNVDLSVAHFPNGDGGWSLVHRPLWYPLPPRGTHSFETRPIAIFYEKMSRKKVCRYARVIEAPFLVAQFLLYLRQE